MQQELIQVRDWAKAKLEAGQEPPWAWYQYMKLVETANAILAGMAATSPRESSPQLDEHQEMHLRLVDSTDQQGNALRHHAGLPVQMPT